MKNEKAQNSCCGGAMASGKNTYNVRHEKQDKHSDSLKDCVTSAAAKRQRTRDCASV